MGAQAPVRGTAAPLINRDFGGFDRPRAVFSNMPIGGFMEIRDYHMFVDDFYGFDAVEVWEVVKDSSASADVQADQENGVVQISSQTTTENDGGLIQALNTSFLVKSGKKLWFEARVKVSDADQCDMFVGLANTASTNPEAVVAEGLARVGFELVDGAADIKYVVDNDTAATKTDSGQDASDDTWVKLGFRTDGGSVRFYVDDSHVGNADIPSAISAVTLGPAFFGLSGNTTGTHTRSIDYVIAVQER